MPEKYIAIERHANDEVHRDLYLVYLENERALDNFLRKLFSDNRIDFNMKQRRWVFRRYKTKVRGKNARRR